MHAAVARLAPVEPRSHKHVNVDTLRVYVTTSCARPAGCDQALLTKVPTCLYPKPRTFGWKVRTFSKTTVSRSSCGRATCHALPGAWAETMKGMSSSDGESFSDLMVRVVLFTHVRQSAVPSCLFFREAMRERVGNRGWYTCVCVVGWGCQRERGARESERERARESQRERERERERERRQEGIREGTRQRLAGGCGLVYTVASEARRMHQHLVGYDPAFTLSSVGRRRGVHRARPARGRRKLHETVHGFSLISCMTNAVCWRARGPAPL